MIGTQPQYRIDDPDVLPTPTMVVFQDQVEHNIRAACDLAGGGRNLFTHVKTHKSSAITKRQIELGIDSFKCATLSELDMVLGARARQAILANPLVQPGKLERLLDLAASHPEAWVAAIAGAPEQVTRLGDAAARRKQRLPVLLDLDAGMHRTGIRPDREGARLYRGMTEHPYLQAAGLHWYDGQDSLAGASRRETAARRHIDTLLAFRRQLEADGLGVSLMVAGGIYSFAFYARCKGMYGSPGSFIYWDASCEADMPEMPFRYAAMILTQVIDRHPDQQTITTDLGSKAICSDLPTRERALLFDHEDAELVLHNEEHGVFRMHGNLPAIGDYLLAVPGHIGPTTPLYPGSHVIDAAGNVVDFFAHDARDRT